MTKTTALRISGMTCGHCVAAVTKALENTGGVRSVRVDLKDGRAEVAYDEDRTTPAELASVVADEGYTVEEDQ